MACSTTSMIVVTMKMTGIGTGTVVSRRAQGIERDTLGDGIDLQRSIPGVCLPGVDAEGEVVCRRVQPVRHRAEGVDELQRIAG